MNVSVMKQYLKTIKSLSYMFEFIKFNGDTEIIFIIKSHYKLQQNVNVNTAFKDCYLFKTSTINQRIKA